MVVRRLGLLLLVCLLALSTNAQEDLEKQLWQAARKGDAETVKALLEKGVDVNAKFNCGVTALFHAAGRGHVAVVKALLEHGAEVNLKDTCYGDTPLAGAAWRAPAEVVKMLLDADATVEDFHLQMSVWRGDTEIVKLVLEKGRFEADALSLALASATRKDQPEIAALLRTAGAVPLPKADFPVKADTLKTYAGVYRNEEGWEWTLFLEEGKLKGGPTAEDVYTLGAFDKVNFRPLEREGLTITFHYKDGQAVGMTLKQIGETRVFKKVKGKQP